MTRQTALVVDDEPDIRELLVLTLGRLGLLVDTAGNVAEARRRLAETEYAFCLTDMRLPDGTGMELVEHVVKNFPGVPIAMITAFGSVDTAVNALKAGAFDFVSKPVDLAVLRRLVQTALKLRDEKRPFGVQPLLSCARQTWRSARKQVGECARSGAFKNV